MEDSSDFIPSRASALKTKINFETIFYESYKPKKSQKLLTKQEIPFRDENKEKELNIKQAKNEIIKLAMSGLDPEQKEKAKINLLIKLGAKPPKNKNKNYKQLQMEQKKVKEEETKKEKFLLLGKNTHGKSTAKGKSFDRKRRKEKGNILSIYGTVKQTSKGNKEKSSLSTLKKFK